MSIWIAMLNNSLLSSVASSLSSGTYSELEENPFMCARNFRVKKNCDPEFRNTFKLVLSLHEGWPHVILHKTYFVSTSYLFIKHCDGRGSDKRTRILTCGHHGEQGEDGTKDTITVESEASFNDGTQGPVRSTQPGFRCTLGRSGTDVAFTPSLVGWVGVNGRGREPSKQREHYLRGPGDSQLPSCFQFLFCADVM